MTDLYEFYRDLGPERCGFILDNSEVIEVENNHEFPTQGFQIDVEVIIRYLPQITAIWHTHPNGTSVLSGADKNYMIYWPDLQHIIIGVDGIRTYKILDEVVINENYTAR